ncbi:MAG: 50S ribosomal protein L30 [Candidatus Thalassarchaeaceae archaeon]|nr:50S ribosomal protein L30 [Candidatus Thalassarchaeaceae archaeon]
MTWLVIRARSDRTVERSIRETLSHLNLTRVNHAVLIPQNETYAGMLQKVKDFVTWGEVSSDAIASMIRDRGRLVGNHPVTDGDVKNSTAYKNIDSFAAAIASGEATTKDMETLKRVFRLHPPRGNKGWGGIKRHFTVGGALGFRGEAIEELAARMM